MSPLLNILRAAHCHSTHHYFAVDALRLVQTDSGMRMRGLLLKYHEQYLCGATDPDTRFRDFQNHVVHVQNGYFGGATRSAIQWYDRLMRHLVAQRWDNAAYAAGVLSHYFTDPLMPLHTGYSQREALVHRPMEWSVLKAYDRILKRWTDDDLRLVFQLGDGEGWLGEAILKGARFSNRSYRRLVESYNVDLGAENPVTGLDDEAIGIFAEIFGLAITGLARIIERAADEAESRSGVVLPHVGSTMASVLAVLQTPEQLWRRRRTNNAERKAIEALIGEYRETGVIKHNLPSEIYIKQRVIQIRDREAAWAARRREREIALGANSAQIVSQPAPLDQSAALDQSASAEAATLESIAATTSSATTSSAVPPEPSSDQAATTGAGEQSTIPFVSAPGRKPIRRAA